MGGVTSYVGSLVGIGGSADEAPPEPSEAPVRDPAIARQQTALDQAVAEARAETGAQVAEVWGEEAALPSRRVWVWYDTRMTTRCFLDFERGEIRAETVVEPGEAPEEAVERLRDMVQKATHDRPAEMAKRDATMRAAAKIAADYGIRVFSPPLPSPSEKPVLAGAVPSDAAARVTAERVAAARVVGADGKERTKLIHRVPFSEGFYAKLAERYADVVLRQARAHRLSPSLVLAVIHNESAFNPRATSHIPAYGLMQIVPKSAGIDAYEFLHGEARLLAPEYLYDPRNNVELGAAYLGLLDRRYLRDVGHPRSRLHCAIAAYNTGAGNVARAFTGGTSMRAAAEVINGMPPERVFAQLQERLPFEETRRYLVKVTDARNNYRAWDDAPISRN
jgi:membrane-bound lytic murein transglycosylase C